ncbi:MAG: flagellar basal body rod protein FlgC [Eubacteriales bacterium]|nr:flagellar basal body rod protein FlgC [Eubacteriales bacterium]MDD3199245.1 flagellar basal body rod protein FlgC [Eubacteriales bacterium]MDD4121412.1 flagellar basal body rod protein FlgC [Eubacteriales bacterium]MDD4629376.1 flagellar basal body rod protein FlgC [Eubacteriales bacterium]
MDYLSSLNISGSGLTAQKLRMDVISQNIANAGVTRTESGAPYRRKMVVLSSINGDSFRDILNRTTAVKAGGVQVRSIVEDKSELVPVYNPNHPDADEEGYVMLPNVNTAQEMIDMMGASRSYEANVTTFNATKSMILKALEIGR